VGAASREREKQEIGMCRLLVKALLRASASPGASSTSTRFTRSGGSRHLEYWIPSKDLEALNAALVGEIEVTVQFP
jgi:hypothetical protein